jgi:apolipoprotein N-acyltransferase
MKAARYPILLAVASGVFLGLAFPPVPTGATIFIAFIPFFVLLASIENYRSAFHYSYITFLVLNIITLYWPSGIVHCRDLYMAVGGILLIAVHPLFYLVPIAIWMFIRRHIGFKISLFLFPFIWTSFEYLHSLTEIAFPWIVLGNTQTYDLAFLQISSFTGSYGISFWIIWINILGFFVFMKLNLREWKLKSWKSVSAIGIILIIYLVPKIYGTWVLRNSKEDIGPVVNIAVIQPNVDTFEKWTGNPEKPVEIAQQITERVGRNGADLVIWPETTPPFYILHPGEREMFERVKKQVDTLNINLLSGIPDIYYYRNDEPAPKSSKESLTGFRYDTYNSSMLLQPGANTIQKYAKIRLVPFAERVPFSEALSFLNAMQWNFGLGGWGIGKDSTVFNMRTQRGERVNFSNFICYESIYPSFVSSFVRKGAEFITVVTNDSWWGNTSGAYQHKQIAVLRAVENRRWLIQCANGGISCFIDPYGRTIVETSMYDQTMIKHAITAKREITFYTQNGDWLPMLCIYIVLAFSVASVGTIFYNRIRANQEKSSEL